MTQKPTVDNSKSLIWPPEPMPMDANATLRLLINARWARENLRAIAAYNQRIERCGVFSDGLRRF